MIQEIVNFLPQTLTTGESAACAGIALAATVLWLMGSAWGRPVCALAAVAIGGTLGMLVPRWMNWPINTGATAVIGAIVFGITGWLAARLWAGLLFAIVMAAWAALAVWLLLKQGASIPRRTDAEIAMLTLPQYARDLWERLPEPVRRVMPFAAATAMITALSITLLWRRVGQVLAFSVTGVSIMLIAMLTLILNRQPNWLTYLPLEPGVQIVVLIGAAMLGALIQWQLLPHSHHEMEHHEELKQQAEDPTRRYE